ncbi:MAG: BTAD domain-containing putative transcriptional regulator [Ilumatobacteraceae bacterium]
MARRDDDVVAIGGPQQRRLLALMLSRPGQSISVNRIVDCLWPDGLAPDGAGRSVMKYVYRLRTVLGESSIETVQGGYRLDLNGSTIDANQFELMLSEAGTSEPGRAVEIYNRALGLWRGVAYGDFGDEWWILAEANRLNEMRIIACEERAEAMMALGQHHRLIPELERLAADHPLRERPVSLLMQALFATGRRADSLRAFHSFRVRLGEETGLDPSTELIALEQSLAVGRPVMDRNTRAKLLRGYTIHELLGQGGFGRVFAATQPGTNREVAIKAIRPDLANLPEFIQRFEAEAQLVARLEHPHIVPLYDYWRDPGGAYLVFRLLLGGTALGAMVNNGPFDVSRVSRVVEEVGAALLAAHTAGVVHCDIKPSNVLFDESDNAYLSDFGIAVRSAMSVGDGDRTRAYAPPELSDRTGDTVQSDIFSFGCMLWHLLVGMPPSAAVRSSPRSHVPSLADSIHDPCEALDAVLFRATAADTTMRFQSMAELIIAWREAVGRPAGVLTPVGPRDLASPGSLRAQAVRALDMAASSAVNPYKGLRPFGEADASDFFGRKEVAAALYEAVVAQGFVAVVGPSGSGKSSLVHAGLVPRLRQDGARVASMVPGDRPTAALREALRGVTALDLDLSEPSEMLLAAVGDGLGRLVLVVDQFEECWTLVDGAERERFLRVLAVAGGFGVWCVMTLRADLYDRPLQDPLIGQLIADGSFALRPLTAEALEEVVVRPAEQSGVSFDEGVVTAIVAEANAQAAGLPLLQFAMAELYDRRVDDRVTSIAVRELGGLGGAIGRRAEEIYLSLDEDMQTNTPRLFGRLVVPGQGAPDTRRRARFGELSEVDRQVADRFIQARLLVADRDLASREPVIEVAHEALLTSWPRLREWLNAGRQWLAQLQHLANATRTWDEANRAVSELYRGSRLEAIIEAFPDHEPQLTDGERMFVDASRAARDASIERERRNSRRLRRLLTTTGCLLALALVAGAIAFTQRQDARASATRANSARRAAQIEALVGRSLSVRGSERDTAALLAIEAYRLQDMPRTRSALLSTFTSDIGFLGTDRLPESLGGNTDTTGIVLADGETALVRGADHAIHTYDLDTGVVGEPWPRMTSEGGGSQLTGSGDGRFVAQKFYPLTGPKPTLIGVFDTARHALVAGPITVPLFVDNVLFSTDDTRLYVSGDSEGTVIAYSIPDSTELARLPGLPPPTDSFLQATTAGLAVVAGGMLAVGSVAGPVRLVDPLTLEVRSQIDAPEGTTERLFAIDDGKSLVGSGAYGRVRLDVTDPSRGPVWEVGTSDVLDMKCEAYVVAEKMGRLYCGDSFGGLEERDLATGGFVRELSAQNGNTGTISLARGQSELVSFSGNESLVSRWRLDGSGPISKRMGNGYSPRSYSPDGRYLLTEFGRGSNSIDWAVFDPETGTRVVDSTGTVHNPNWNAAGNLYGLVDADTKPTVATLDVATDHFETSDLTLPAVPARDFSSRHRAWLYFPATDNQNGPGEVWTYDTDTNTRIEPTIKVDSFVTASGTDSGDRVAIGTFTGTTVFDGTTGVALHTFAGVDRRGAYILPGRRLVVMSFGGEMTMYDLDSFETVATLGGIRGFGYVIGSDDGSTAVAAGNDRVTIIYDTVTGDQIGDSIVIPDTEANGTVTLRPDGKELAIGGSYKADFTVWDLDPAHWVTAGCHIAGRNLTQQEWKTNIGDLAEYHRTCPEYD